MPLFPVPPASPAMKNPDNFPYAYPQSGSSRDLRIDFLRGLVMMVVITVHLEFISLFGMFVWERIGLVSSAEGFVALSGLVVGIVYRKKLIQEGFSSTAKRLLKRAFLLYKVNVAVILSIALLGLIPFIDIHEVTHWSMANGSGPVYPLYPPPATPWYQVVYQALLLKIGPHQFQVIGLYVVLLAISPLALFMMERKQTPWLLFISWGIYAINQVFHIQLLSTKFDLAFPLLNWQLIFINSMAAGFHRQRITEILQGMNLSALTWFAGLLCLGFLFLAHNMPHPIFWPFPSLGFIDPDLFTKIYNYGFHKGGLGIGRIVNNLALFIIAYTLLTRYWKLINKPLGWLLIPIGQASLYVFIVHVYFVLLVSNTPVAEINNFYLNTLVHLLSILAIWLMVKQKFLFRLIPR